MNVLDREFSNARVAKLLKTCKYKATILNRLAVKKKKNEIMMRTQQYKKLWPRSNHSISREPITSAETYFNGSRQAL